MRSDRYLLSGGAVFVLWFLLLVFSSILTPAIANDSVQDFNTEPAEAEQDSTRLMAERWRMRHDAEYNDPEIAKLRVSSKQAEKDLLDLRRQFAMHMRANYSEIRAMEKVVREQFSRIETLREEEEVLLREDRIAAREILAVESGTKEEQGLSSVHIRQKIADAEREVVTARTALESRTRELAAEDEKASVMLDDISLLENEYEESFRRLNARIDELPAIREHDEMRVRRMNEAHELRVRAKAADSDNAL